MGSGAQEDGAEGDIEHEGEEEDAEAKRPGGGLVVEVVEPVHEVVDVDVGADGDERVEAVLGHLVLEGRATQPQGEDGRGEHGDKGREEGRGPRERHDAGLPADAAQLAVPPARQDAAAETASRSEWRAPMRQPAPRSE